ncbi:MAG: hypothetical protein OCC49_17705 [Fibrobacterales bacterium]
MILFFITLTSCDCVTTSSFHIQLSIFDQNGNPINGATIKLSEYQRDIEKDTIIEFSNIDSYFYDEFQSDSSGMISANLSAQTAKNCPSVTENNSSLFVLSVAIKCSNNKWLIHEYKNGTDMEYINNSNIIDSIYIDSECLY